MVARVGCHSFATTEGEIAERYVDQRHGRLAFLTFLLAFLTASAPAFSQLVPGSLDVHWTEGAEDCAANPQPTFQVHAYESQTFILRQSPCADFEANFLYLVEDQNRMPLADTVLRLLPHDGTARMPLLVVHTHKHLDHRAGDPQFEGLPGVQVIASDLDSVRTFFGFKQWPEGIAHLDLGGRIVDAIPGARASTGSRGVL
jgi:hydroxyacylglutathione hydrolase